MPFFVSLDLIRGPALFLCSLRAKRIGIPGQARADRKKSLRYGVVSRVAGNCEQPPLDDVSYTLTGSYLPRRLFPIVVTGLRGRLIAGAQNKPLFPCPTAWRNRDVNVDIIEEIAMW